MRISKSSHLNFNTLFANIKSPLNVSSSFTALMQKEERLCLRAAQHKVLILNLLMSGVGYLFRDCGVIHTGQAFLQVPNLPTI